MKYLFTFILIFSLSKNSFADATGEVVGDAAKGAAVGAAAGYAQSKLIKEAAGTASKSIGDFLDTPAGVATTSGIAMVYSGILYKAAAQQESDSDKNIEKIDRIMATFRDSFLSFCPDGRDDLNNPGCYCYLADGSQNPNRSNSKICQDAWAKNKYKNTVGASDYKATGNPYDVAGCMTVTGQFDQNCKCKKFVDSKGTNACLKTVSVNLPNSLAGAMVNGSGIKELLQFTANATNGNPNLAGFNPASLGLKAIATKKLTQQLLDQATKDGKKINLPSIDEKNVGKYANALLGEKNIAAAMNNSKSALDIGSAGLGANASPLLKAAAAKAGLDLVGSGKGLQNKKEVKKDGFTLNLGNDSSTNQAGVVQNFAEPEKTYKINDISKQTDTSLFEIISNRYINSGLKRLFDN